MNQRLTLKDFNIFSRNNPLNRVETPEKTLTLFALFLPILTEYLLRQLMNSVSIYIMGRVSDDAVAAIGVATEIFNMFTLVYMVVSTGATVVINQNLGAGRKERAEKAANAAIIVSAAMAVIFGLVIVAIAPSLIRLMNLEERLVPQGAAYLRIVVGVSVFNAIMTTAMAECRAYGNTVYPVMCSVLMNVINAAFSYIVVFRPFETPFSGVSGIACARVGAEAISCVLMLYLLKKVNPGMRYFRLKELSGSVLKDIIRIGAPSGMQYLSYSLTQAVTTSILATIGTQTLSAKIYVYNIVYYAYLLGMALGQANGLLVGRLVGQGKYERVRKMTVRNLFITVSINVIFSSVLALFRFRLLGIFTSDPVILAAGAVAMCLDIIVEIGRGINHTFEGALVAAADVRFPMITTLCTTWGLSVLFSYILGVRLGMGLAGCWIAFALDEGIRGTCYILRWRSGKWSEKALVR